MYLSLGDVISHHPLILISLLLMTFGIIAKVFYNLISDEMYSPGVDERSVDYLDSWAEKLHEWNIQISGQKVATTFAI